MAAQGPGNAYNRTIEELKSKDIILIRTSLMSYNRTIEELKYITG